MQDLCSSGTFLFPNLVEFILKGLLQFHPLLRPTAPAKSGPGTHPINEIFMELQIDMSAVHQKEKELCSGTDLLLDFWDNKIIKPILR